MEPAVDKLSQSFEFLLASIAGVLKSRKEFVITTDPSLARRNFSTALKLFYYRFQQFHAACDDVQLFLDSKKKAVIEESLFDEVRGIKELNLTSENVIENILHVSSLEELLRTEEDMAEPEKRHPFGQEEVESP